jgi:hypothetical protein
VTQTVTIEKAKSLYNEKKLRRAHSVMTVIKKITCKNLGQYRKCPIIQSI